MKEKAHRTYIYPIKVVLRILWDVDKKKLMLVCIMNVISGWSISLNIYATSLVLNEITSEGDMMDKIQFIIFFFAYNVIMLLISNYSKYLEFCYRGQLSIYVNDYILDIINSFGLSMFENSEIYDLVQKAERIKDDVLFDYASNIMGLLISFLNMISLSTIIYTWKPQMLIFVITISCISSYGKIYFGRQRFMLLDSRQEDERKKWYYSFLLKNEGSIKEIKLYNLHDFFRDKVNRLALKFFQEDKEVSRREIIFSFISEILELFFSISVIVLIMVDSLTGGVSIGTVYSYVQSSNAFKDVLMTVLTRLSSLSSHFLYLGQFIKFVELQDFHMLDCKEDMSTIGDVSEISVKSLSFSTNGQDRLKNINFTFKKGEKYYIIGKNGSGKSTLLKCLMGLYDIQGQLLINGEDISHDNGRLTKYWRQIGVLFQDFVKYELTLRENIALNKIVLDSNIIDCMGQLDHKFFERHTIDEQLGFWFMEGRQLSGGEWLKISLLRAILQSTSVLILDEPDAYLDAVSKKKCEELTRKNPHKITIVVTHDLEVVSDPNAIIVLMDRGEIVGCGKYEEIKDNHVFEELLQAFDR
ncbi:ABC transporter ATP-binding protein [uncultured Abiotrophia sp.]|uniref:ATP-binding cassette domain-containing protein n=1 Tax=uncultured Abiotrophia sp. TaxID=316094 RepID=UPI00260F8533|nr:ABC transporter ATP-binding protein [uncultured Abiotrophia sp.]